MRLQIALYISYNYDLVIRETIDNVNSITPHCKLGNRVSVSGVLFKPKCEDFKPVITNRGICYAYNAEPFTKFAVESPFTETFSQAYKEELGEDTEVHNNLGSGKSFGLEFWLDSQVKNGANSFFIIFQTILIFSRRSPLSKPEPETHSLSASVTRSEF